MPLRIAVLVLVAILAVLTAGPDPALTAVADAELTAVPPATVAPAASAKSSHSCSFDAGISFGRMPETISDPLDPSVLARYAVLRRPVTATDQPPPVNSLADQVDFALGRYNPAYIRQLTQRPGGRRFFVVAGLPPHMEIPPARCLPAKLRPQRPKLVEQQARRERLPIACIVTIAPNRSRTESFGGVRCPRFRDVTKYENLSSGLLESREHAGILPDEIAAVRVHFRQASTVQVPVVENFYLYKVDPALRKKVLRQLRQIQKRFAQSSKSRTGAQRRKLERRFIAATSRAARQVAPTNVELLAADGRVVKDVKRTNDSELGIGIPLEG